MVKLTNKSRKSAFTMIELIFAIVIIAISVMSLPMVTQVTQRGIENSILQEAVFAASAELMGATAGYWDENSMQDSADSHLSRVIDITGDCIANLRPGHIAQQYHRRCLNNTGTGANNAAGGVVWDLDNAEHGDADMFTDTITDATGYKETYQSNIDVSPAADNNIKIITATIKDSDGDEVVVLRSQSANIGEVDYFKRML